MKVLCFFNMVFELRNEQLKVSAGIKGAEITSVLYNGREYIWQAQGDIWPRHAPVLFPVVGKLKSDSYHYSGKEYSLTQHGFARDQDFSFVYKTNTELELELIQNDDTLLRYPFIFKLTIKYKLTGNKLECLYRVTNTSGTEKLLFSIGAHPGFRIPLAEGESFSDYVLEFTDGNFYKLSELSGGLISGQTKDLMLLNGRLPLDVQLFEKDALVFEGSQINCVTLKSLKLHHGVKMHCDGWPFFGIWSKPGCDKFVCLEPWYGVADSVTASGEIAEKKGIISLMPGEFFNCRYSIEFF